ncbi:MAG: diaminopimelate decarboxylase [Lentisphaerae bacterium]|jgi:diaminopimelate decarboxylase|nr:diaminopimelate decarboxylase [Lentisphaerota bacterium]MBT4819223.1 diaminopimelate decarboxylase [Lentisphaerota bacterium]MBT5611030.1 diaminopimelate decarboxylase [Lentisphaerota bacterium]MBT7053974.1 diaminopimelate decarboxylase [Lentisphaerota bacterium]MBT7841056.1 diaminopimelate decarboxylase [Lentisphaerota bacterium]
MSKVLGTSIELTGGQYTIQGLPAVEMAERFGTPLYVYDGDWVNTRYSELYDLIAWPRLRVLYAMKANYSPAILRLLLENGAYLDTVSPGEVELALKIGFPPGRLLYTANSITDAEMTEVQSKGVLLNIGSLSRLEKYGRAFPGTEVCLRFNPDVVAGSHAKIQTGGDLTKFGILLQDLPRVLELAATYRLSVVGLHEHTGSGISETDKVFQSMRNLLSIATPEAFPELRFVDFGGGFKVPYSPDEKRIDYASFGAQIRTIFAEFCAAYGRDLDMYFEPGKYVVAESGYMIVEVNTLKNNKGRLIAGTNSGFGHLIRPMIYDAYHHIVNLSNPHGPPRTYDVCGNICETGDRFATDRVLPEVCEGDLLAILNAGAYCCAMGSVYNLRPLPTEVLVHKGQATLARKGLSNVELADEILRTYE